MNYVVCHTKHTKAFDGKEGTDWGHSHQEFDVKVGGTIGFVHIDRFLEQLPLPQLKV